MSMNGGILPETKGETTWKTPRESLRRSVEVGCVGAGDSLRTRGAYRLTRKHPSFSTPYRLMQMTRYASTMIAGHRLSASTALLLKMTEPLATAPFRWTRQYTSPCPIPGVSRRLSRVLQSRSRAGCSICPTTDRTTNRGLPFVQDVRGIQNRGSTTETQRIGRATVQALWRPCAARPDGLWPGERCYPLSKSLLRSEALDM